MCDKKKNYLREIVDQFMADAHFFFLSYLSKHIFRKVNDGSIYN